MSPMFDDNRRFFGMTKGQFYGLVLALVLASLVLNTFTLLKAEKFASQGAQAHTAVCAYKANLTDNLRRGEHVLGLNRQQLIAQYGIRYANLIEAVPKATLVAQIGHERKAVESLHALRCP